MQSDTEMKVRAQKIMFKKYKIPVFLNILFIFMIYYSPI